MSQRSVKWAKVGSHSEPTKLFVDRVWIPRNKQESFLRTVQNAVTGRVEFRRETAKRNGSGGEAGSGVRQMEEATRSSGQEGASGEQGTAGSVREGGEVEEVPSGSVMGRPRDQASGEAVKASKTCRIFVCVYVCVCVCARMLNYPCMWCAYKCCSSYITQYISSSLCRQDASTFLAFHHRLEERLGGEWYKAPAVCKRNSDEEESNKDLRRGIEQGPTSNTNSGLRSSASATTLTAKLNASWELSGPTIRLNRHRAGNNKDPYMYAKRKINFQIVN